MKPRKKSKGVYNSLMWISGTSSK